jgi:hypothetical protein
MRCRRSDGSLRGFWLSREQAEKFAQDPKNTSYRGDIVVGPCGMCGAFHCSRPAWVANTSVRLPDDPIHCAVCTEEIAVNGSDPTFLPFLIMPDGLALHESCCGREPLGFESVGRNRTIN